MEVESAIVADDHFRWVLAEAVDQSSGRRARVPVLGTARGPEPTGQAKSYTGREPPPFDDPLPF